MSFDLPNTLHSLSAHLLCAGLLLLAVAACSDVVDAVPGTEPTVEVVGPADLATLTSDVVTMTCVVSKDVVRVSYTVNGAESIEVEFSSLEYSFPVQGLVDGKNTVELTVESQLGVQYRTLHDIIWRRNNRPETTDDYTATELRRPSCILVLENDRSRGLEIDSFEQPENGRVTLDPNNDNRLEYTADKSSSGLDAFEYTIVAGNGETDEVRVLPRNPTAPTANDDTVTTEEDTAIGIDMLANDTDDPLQVSGASDPENGTVELLYDGFETARSRSSTSPTRASQEPTPSPTT